MNAKFEKWCDDNRHSERMCDLEIWQAGSKEAIQSLEVTMELRRMAYEAFCKSVPKSCLSKTYAHALYIAIDAVLSALKEQAK